MYSERERRRLARMCYPYEIEKEYVALAAAYIALLYVAIKAYMPELKRAQARLNNIQSPSVRNIARRKEARRIVNKARRKFKRLEITFKIDVKIDVVVNKIEIFRNEAMEALELETRKKRLRLQEQRRRKKASARRKKRRNQRKNKARAIPIRNRTTRKKTAAKAAKSKKAAAWAKKNKALMKSLTEGTWEEAYKIILDGWQKGMRHEAIAKKIEKKCNITKNKAKFWARDQCAKLNADLTRQEQEAAGIKEYIWSTSGDERVRGNPAGKWPKAKHSHYAIDGKRCKWEDPTVYKSGGEWVKRPSSWVQLHVGKDFQCRCVPLPCFDLPGLAMPWEKV